MATKVHPHHSKLIYHHQMDRWPHVRKCWRTVLSFAAQLMLIFRLRMTTDQRPPSSVLLSLCHPTMCAFWKNPAVSNCAEVIPIRIYKRFYDKMFRWSFGRPLTPIRLFNKRSFVALTMINAIRPLLKHKPNTLVAMCHLIWNWVDSRQCRQTPYNHGMARSYYSMFIANIRSNCHYRCCYY